MIWTDTMRIAVLGNIGEAFSYGKLTKDQFLGLYNGLIVLGQTDLEMVEDAYTKYVDILLVWQLSVVFSDGNQSPRISRCFDYEQALLTARSDYPILENEEDADEFKFIHLGLSCHAKISFVANGG